MGWRLANSLSTLRDQIDGMYPGRNKASDGTIGDAAHAAVKSEHNPNAAGVVTAIDITHDPTHGLDIQQLAETLVASADYRIWYIIANRRIWEAGNWRPYSGTSDPHINHLHLSTKQSRAEYDNGAGWQLIKEGDTIMVGVGIAAPPIYVTRPNTERIDIFCRGTDNGLYQKYFDKAGWHGWYKLGESVLALDTVIRDGERYDIFCRGGAQDVMHFWLAADGWHLESLGKPVEV